MVRGVCKLNYNLAHLTWFKVGGAADVLFKPEDTEDLSEFLKQNASILPVTVLGAGSNVIIRDKGIEGIVVKLGRGFTDIALLADGTLAVGAACLNFNLAKFVQSHSIKGFEFLVGIPGTIGGGVAMNAGAYGNEFKDIVISVQALDLKGNMHYISLENIGFSYRCNSLPKDLVITKVIFKVQTSDAASIKGRMDEINKNRSATQPITEKTGGSTFANPDGHKAWELIDAAGMRSKAVGGASMSSKHCNFMINNGNATASNMEQLGELVRAAVKAHSGIELQWEIKRIGRNGRI
ncbi:MAG: UDP-N-acetylmuramate dehydrogenase [Rickettsiaceae bacterium]|nr:UDP-N-acetylmuramate dehydrogenase [Rickettsiaceae bacterium]MDP5020518.1 UDP-N-acetylmuramate dehydrogenase [Rickettsiaceae bacterium]